MKLIKLITLCLMAFFMVCCSKSSSDDTTTDDTDSDSTTEITDEQVEAMFEAATDINDKFSELLAQDLDYNEQETQLIEYINSIEEVDNVTSDNSGWLTIEYDSGLVSYVMLYYIQDYNNETDEVISQSQVQSTIEVYQANYDLMTRSDSGAAPILITNPKVFIWDAFYDDICYNNDGTYYLFNDISTIISDVLLESPINITSNDIKYLHDSECDVASLHNLTDYNIIIFHTHGSGGELIATREEGSIEEKEELRAKNISLSSVPLNKTKSAAMYKMITSNYIASDYIVGTFPNSIIFNGSCHSAKDNSSLKNAFIKKGAGEYLGFSEATYFYFFKRKAVEYFENLLFYLKNTKASYIEESLYVSQKDVTTEFKISDSEDIFYFGNGINIDESTVTKNSATFNFYISPAFSSNKSISISLKDLKNNNIITEEFEYDTSLTTLSETIKNLSPNTEYELYDAKIVDLIYKYEENNTLYYRGNEISETNPIAFTTLEASSDINLPELGEVEL